MNIDGRAHIIGPAFDDTIQKIPGVTTAPHRYGMAILKNGETVINIGQTDYPRTNYGPEHVEELPISAEDKALMLGGNAEAVFRIS